MEQGIHDHSYAIGRENVIAEMFPGITSDEALPVMNPNAEQKTSDLTVSLPEAATSR